MNATDESYFLKRAEDELVNARAAGNRNAAKAHFQRAGLYLNRAHSGEAAKEVGRYLGVACAGKSGIPIRSEHKGAPRTFPSGI